MAMQSPSFDTCGWFARDVETFARVGSVLLGVMADEAPFGRLLIAEDAFAIAEPVVRVALAPAVAQICRRFPSVERTSLAGPEGILAWSANQRPLQAAEFHATFQPWIEAHVPRFSIEVGRSLTLASLITEAELVAPREFRVAAKAGLTALLGEDAVLCLPTVPILAPGLDEPFSAMRRAVERIIELTAIAGLTGAPQINLPLATHEGIPVGLSLIGPAGSDARLLALARRLANAT